MAESIKQVASPFVTRSAIFSNPDEEIRTARLATCDSHQQNQEGNIADKPSVGHVIDVKPQLIGRLSIWRLSWRSGAGP